MNESHSFYRWRKKLVTSTSEKYDKILQAAIEVISEKGLDKTSISDIVKRAGVAQGTFIFISDLKMLLFRLLQKTYFLCHLKNQRTS